jgi:alkylation response protein AidB-like acyl-CoA dehydrogenase
LFEKMANNGYMGITVKREYGGAEAGYVSLAIVMEEIARECVSSTLYITSPNSLVGLPIQNFGTEEQKEKYLKPVVSGEKQGTFALTEPGAGSDASAQQAMAIRQGDYYIINGRKKFITAGPVADYAIVFAMTDKSKGLKGITAFIIDKDTEGYSSGKPERKMGIKGSPTSDIFLKNVKVHKAQILGKEGEGFTMAMKTLDSGRIGVSAQAVGIAQAAMDEAVKHVKNRVQFGKPLSKMQGIQFMLADMETKLNCARALVYDAAQKKMQ